MYHYIRDKVFLKDMKYLCSNIINQLVQLINNDSLILKRKTCIFVGKIIIIRHLTFTSKP